MLHRNILLHGDICKYGRLSNAQTASVDKCTDNSLCIGRQILSCNLDLLTFGSVIVDGLGKSKITQEMIVVKTGVRESDDDSGEK